MRYVLYHATWCPFCRVFAPIFRKHIPEGEEVLLDDEHDTRWTELNIEYVPTIIAYDGKKEVKRLQAVPHKGITEDMLKGFMEE
ncbi:MAG: thioredoxin family protein [Thermoplasmatota archaeon]